MENNNIFRPKTFDEFIGNNEIIEKLKIYIFSSKFQNKQLDHVLFYGPPGTGKTSLSYLIANEFKQKIFTVNGANIEKISDVISILSSLNKFDILFIDEIHKINHQIEEIFYSIMEDFKISIKYTTNDSSKIMELNVEPFTLIGATTKLGNLSLPLRERFGITFHLELYSKEELSKIIKINAQKINLKIDEEATLEIAKRAKQIPRIAINYLKRVHDFSIYDKQENIDRNYIISIFKKLDINEDGLDKDDIKIIKILYENYKNEPVSLSSISLILNDNVSNLENIYEPYLVSNGIIERTKRGRRLTDKGIRIYRSLR